MRKIVTVLGARPQFIKASVVSEALRATGTLHEVLVHTGQHFDPNMSDVFFSELRLPAPTHQLDIHGGPHGEMTGRMLAAVEHVLLAERPDAVLVYGDTNSTLAGALAAVKLHLPVAHVEAGLRSGNLAMPEEVNRVLTDRISRWLFTPTVAAREHLLREGVAASQIVEVGDVMYDAALHHGTRAAGHAAVRQRLRLEPGRYALVTVHRAENTDVPARMATIVDAVCRVSAQMPVVWPVHPRVAALLRAQAPQLVAHPALSRRSCGLPGDGVPGARGRGHRNRFRRRAEGGLLPSRALRDAARRNRMGGTGGDRLEPPGPAAGRASRGAGGVGRAWQPRCRGAALRQWRRRSAHRRKACA